MKDVQIVPGKYVVAVSGGVDSMVLLDVLRQKPGVQLVVAHFEHGMRADSLEDLALVQRIAQKYELPFAFDHGNLGPNSSEAAARQARYNFLRKTMQEHGAQAIITAHHQDDMLETAIINLLRGTGRRGLSSLANHPGLLRPLLHWTKQDIYNYAQEHDIQWREDSTNTNEQYLRNYIRRTILPKWQEADRQTMLDYVNTARQVNQELDNLLTTRLNIQMTKHKIDRRWFIDLPYIVAREIMAAWLRTHGARFDRRLIDRLVVAAKTYKPGKRHDIDASHQLIIEKQHLYLHFR